MVSSIFGCTGGAEIDVSQVREYADPIAENILLAINANDYDKYTEHFDKAMKNAIPEAVFQQQDSLIKA